MDTPIRIDATQAYQKTRDGEAILVCAYEDEDKCRRLRLDGAYTLGEFRARCEKLPRDTEVIFYCT
jgi:hypothetical protein